MGPPSARLIDTSEPVTPRVPLHPDRDPAVFATRQAVATLGRATDGVPARPVLVACSGGADSLALAAAMTWQRRRDPDNVAAVIGVTVDHGLQPGSAARADRVREQLAELGVDQTVSVRVQVEAAGQGPEAAAREARYAVLGEVAQRLGAGTVLLGHTLDDQAETVLLGLTRGSGARSLRGMRATYTEDGVSYARPFLGLRRAQTEQACRQLALRWWEDPHNTDPRYTRSRVRHRVLPLLETELGPGIAESLARTARLISADEAVLDALANGAFRDRYDESDGFLVAELAAMPEAVRLRVLRAASLAAGVPAGELALVHLDALDAQVRNLTQLPKTVELPGFVRALRTGDRLRFERDTP